MGRNNLKVFSKWEEEPTLDEANEANEILGLLGLCGDLSHRQRMEVIEAMVLYGRAVHEYTLITQREN